MEIHGKNMTGIDKSAWCVLHCMKPLRRRSNRRHTHRDCGTSPWGWLKARSQRTGKWTVEGVRNVGIRADWLPISMARRKASVIGLRVCRHSNEVGELYARQTRWYRRCIFRICPCMGTGAFFVFGPSHAQGACWASLGDCRQSQSLIGQCPTSVLSPR